MCHEFLVAWFVFTTKFLFFFPSNAASSMWPPAVDTKSLFDPVMSFMGNTSDEKPDTLEDSMSTDNPSQIEGTEEEGPVKLATEHAVSVEAKKETNVRREADQAENPVVTENVVLDLKDDEPESQMVLEESSENSLQNPESSGYMSSREPNEKPEMTASQDSQPKQPESEDAESELDKSQPEDAGTEEVTVENKDTVYSPVLDGLHKIPDTDEITNEQASQGENLEERTSSINVEVSPDMNNVYRTESPDAHPSISESDGPPYVSSVPERSSSDEISEKIVDFVSRELDSRLDASELNQSQRSSSATNVSDSADVVLELEKTKKEIKMLENALQGAARQAQVHL